MYVRHLPLATQREGGFPASELIPHLDERDLDQAARSDASVLFTGPLHVRTLALRIHSLSGWRWGPFLAVDCSAAESTIEQQLFSLLEADAVPSDAAPAPRLLQRGTVFLHEVGRLTLPAQRRLRDLLDDASNGTRMGRSRRRIMASTSEPLLPRVVDGTFDDRLFYRLNVLHFVLPAAR